jgi:ATP-dependent helicase/nuclease subunit B
MKGNRMLRIICGVAGSGKSAELEKRILQDVSENRRAFLLVPEQESIRCERRMADILPESSALCFEVVNFSRLANLVFRHYGSLSYNYASEPVKALLMWRTLSMTEGQLRHFRGIYENGGVKKMLSGIKALRAAGVSPTQLALCAERLDSGSHLSKKLEDLALVSNVYSGLLGEKYDDSASDLDRLCEILSCENFFSGCNVYIDSFTSFTGQELGVLRHIIAQADNVCVGLLCDKLGGREPHFLEVYKTGAQLLELSDRAGIECKVDLLSGSVRACDESLRFIAENLWSTPVRVWDKDSDAIRLIESEDSFDEAEKIACDILRRVHDGAKFSDIAIVYRDASAYRGIIDEALMRAGIPYFMSECSDSESKPLVKLIENAIQIISRGWRRKDIVSYLKTGLAGFDEEAIDLFELYTAAWDINGREEYSRLFTANPDGYQENISEWKAYQLDMANTVRQGIMEPLESMADVFVSGCTVEDVNAALIAFLEKLGVENKITDMANELTESGRFGEASDLIHLWNLIVSAISDMTEAMSDTEVTPQSYLQMLKLLFEELSVPRLPEYVDTVVIGSANMLRVGSVRHVYLAGVSDREFPGSQSDSGIFSLPELKQLGEMGIEIDSSADVRASSELLYFYRAFCSAYGSVTLSAPAASASGELKNPSVALVRLMKILPKLADNKEHIELFELINSDSSLLCHYADSDDPSFASAVSIVAEQRGIALPSPEARELRNMNVSVSREIAQSILADGAKFSQSKLELYKNCPFSYYCKYMLELDAKGTVEFGADIRGTLIHHVLEEFLKQIAFEGRDFGEISESEISEMTERIVGEYLERICNGTPTTKIVNMAARLKRLLRIIIRNICAEFAQSSFRPSCFELYIGEGSDVMPLVFELDDGSRVTVEGYIDRLDSCTIDGKTYVRVVDYKNSEHQINLDDIRSGEKLQMLIYLFAVCNGATDNLLNKLGAQGKLLPAGVLYFGNLGREAVSEDNVYDEALGEKLAEKNLKKDGLLLDDERVLRAMESELEGKYIPVSLENRDKKASKILFSFDMLRELYSSIEATICDSVSRIRSGDASATPSSGIMGYCDYCQLKEICRKG